MIRLLLLLLLAVVAFPIAVDAADTNPAQQAYRDRMKARKADALAERARINAARPPAVYGFRTGPQRTGPVEMVYSASQRRMVPSRYQRVAVPSRYGSGYYVTVARVDQYQPGDQFKKNPDGSVSLYRNGVRVVSPDQKQGGGKKRRKKK